MVSMLLQRLVEVVDRRLQLGQRAAHGAEPVDLTSPSLEPTRVLIDSVISRTFLIATLASPASAEVTPSMLAAM